jgi:hypothetical protein
MSSTHDLPDHMDETSTSLHRTIGLDCRRHNGVRHFSVAAKEILRILNEQINVSHSACHERDDSENLNSDKLADIRTRFLLWTGNLGVMHEPEDPRALDGRVQGAPEVANRICDILEDLQHLLSQCEPVPIPDTTLHALIAIGLKSDRQSHNSETLQQAVVVQQKDTIDDGEAMMLQLFGLQTSKGCTASWLSAAIDDALRRLFHLSSLITKSSTRDKFTRSGLKCRLEMYEPYDVQYVREKVGCAGGRAEDFLITRLGKANTSRRQFVRYSRQRYAELSLPEREEDIAMDRETVQGKHSNPSGKPSVKPATLRSGNLEQSLAPTKASTMGYVDPDEFDYGLDDAKSSTTIATSVVDGGSFSGLRVPELAHFAKPGEHLLCPLCHTIQRFNSQFTWR